MVPWSLKCRLTAQTLLIAASTFWWWTLRKVTKIGRLSRGRGEHFTAMTQTTGRYTWWWDLIKHLMHLTKHLMGNEKTCCLHPLHINWFDYYISIEPQLTTVLLTANTIVHLLLCIRLSADHNSTMLCSIDHYLAHCKNKLVVLTTELATHTLHAQYFYP